jgi:hypothetical protein
VLFPAPRPRAFALNPIFHGPLAPFDIRSQTDKISSETSVIFVKRKITSLAIFTGKLFLRPLYVNGSFFLHGRSPVTHQRKPQKITVERYKTLYQDALWLPRNAMKRLALRYDVLQLVHPRC